MTPTEQQEPPMRAPRNDDWIEWMGGECPIKSSNTLGVVRFRCGKEAVITTLFHWAWGHSDDTHDITAYRITENHEPKEADMTGKTLAELNVKPGYVVIYDGTKGGSARLRTIAGWQDDKCYSMDQKFGGCESMTVNASVWHLVSRAPVATPTLADLTAQRDALAAELADLDAQIAATPETVRVWWWGNKHPGYATHYRDVPLINGVPEGFVKVEGR